MNLVIGNTSQLAQYFPDDYIKISSRDIDMNYLKNNSWNSIYITFAEQRIYESNIDYITPNYFYTLKIIENLLKNSNKIVCYTSCELWNKINGKISLDTHPNFFPLTNEYTISKLLLFNKINSLKQTNELYKKIIFMHPFYFNSVARSEYFLFGKIFHSIINKKKINVGSLDFHRDMVHTKFVVEKSIEKATNCMIGSGKLFNIKKFVKDLYELNNLDFNEFVTENSNSSGKEKLMMADVSWDYTYKNLLDDTQKDILNYKNKKGK